MYLYLLFGLVAWFLYSYLLGLFANYHNKFGNKVVIIVGASSGLGEELALQIAQYHPKGLLLAARRLDKLEEIKKKCELRGANSVTILKADITSQSDCRNIINVTIDQYQKIDILFLNAGIAMTSSLYKLTDPEPLKRVFETDLVGVVNTAFYALPALRISKGHIVVTSSAYGKIPGLGLSAYCASKHALHGFFDCLRVEETRNNIHVTLVCPGYIKTAIHDRALGSDGKEVGSHKKTALFAYTETTISVAANNILKATATNQTEVCFPFLVNFAVRLRGIIGPGVFDWLLYGSK